MGKKVTRLLDQFKPKNYDLSITISADKKSFTGKIIISGNKIGRPSKRLTFHQKGLKILSCKVSYKDKKGIETEVEITRIVLHKSYDEVRLHSENTIYPGEHTVSLEFSGKITDNMDGIYPCNFVIEGVKKQLIATQFESHAARQVLPCIDEPAAKATFDFTLTHAKNEVALSNTPIKSESSNGDTTTTKFEQTPIMSTYLLAFVTGELSMLETKSSSGVQIRTFSTPDQIKATEFALDIAAKCMDFYEEYYDIPFPLAKCDFIALPDFASGAMENWGLITFREQALLVDEHTSIGSMQYVALVVAHELTHQWFGNLVTMQWWTDLWLNEGFASWMEYLAIDNFYPEWDLWTQFAIDEQQIALKIDSLEHTHPVEVPVGHPDEIRTIFDAISYQKGASMIHMLHDYLGPEDFKNGLRHYLKENAYKNTITADLWRSLEIVSKKPVVDFMGKWTSQSGYPILDVDISEDHLKISQSRYISNPNSEVKHTDKTLWPIPLLSEGLEKSTTNVKSLNVVLKDKNKPIKLNIGQTGFYRVRYSHKMLQEQLKALDNNELTEIDRMGLLSDSLDVTRSGYQSVAEFLDLLKHYDDETTLPVWEIIASAIGSVKSILSIDDSNNDLRDKMNPFVQKYVSDEVARIGWDRIETESHLTTLLRPLILGLSAGAEDFNTEKHALDLYRNKIDNNKKIDPDIRGIVYSVAAKNGGQKEFDEMLNLYKKSTSSDEKLTLTGALTNFKQDFIHEQILALVKTDTIRLQDQAYWIAYSLSNRWSRKLTWNWLKENWLWLKLTNGTDLSFSRLPMYAARNFSDQKYLDEYVEFFSTNMEPMIARTYNQGLETIQTNIEWRNRDAKNAIDWFSKNTQY